MKPDGTKLFIGWYDRRKNTDQNRLIETYGMFANLPITNDSVYHPHVDQCDSRCCGSFGGTYRDHMGDYDTAVCDNQYVYYTWADNRNISASDGQTRNQADVRFVRISWPR